MSNIGVYNWRNSSDCITIRNKYNRFYNTNITLDELIRDGSGIWYEMSFYQTGYIDDEENRDYYTFALLSYKLETPITRESVISYSKSPHPTDSDIINITISSLNTDGSITILIDWFRISTHTTNFQLNFYICGCNENESIMCGCCVDCCKIAETVKDNYEKKLL